MKRSLIAVLVIMMVATAITGAMAQEETMQFGRFGTLHVVRKSAQPAHIALFVSGDGGGWEQRMVDMAHAFADLDTLLVVIDINEYLKQLEAGKESCAYPAAELELLSKYVQKKLNWPQYVTPLLIGYSSGATLVYAALVQAPPNTFCGAISLGFCPDLPLTKPLCRGYGLEWVVEPKKKGYSLLPATNLAAPWIALQGPTDQVCPPAITEAFVQKVKGGEIIMLPSVGHGFSEPSKWMQSVKPAFLRVIANDKSAHVINSPSVKDLPLVEVPAQGDASNTLAVILSGIISR